MIFSVNSSIVYYNSGIEHAEIKRTRLFHRYHEPTLILLDNLDVNNHYYTQEVGLPDKEFINMYDYYQHACTVPNRSLRLKDLKIARDPRSTVQHTNGYDIVKLGSKSFYVYYFWQKGHQDCVRKVQCFNSNDCYEVDDYDFRGFLSRQMFFKPDSKYEVGEHFLTPSGKIAVRKVLVHKKDKFYSKYYVWGAKRALTGRDHLILHFFNLMCLKYGSPRHPVIFVADRWWRNRTVDNVLDAIKYPHYTAFYTHYSHVANASKFMTDKLDARFKHIVWQAHHGVSPRNSYDSLIFSTARQGHDFQQRCRIPRRIFTVPVGIQDVKGIEHRLLINQRKPWQITCMTRVSPEEGILDLLKAFCLARQRLPHLKLDIYGKMGAYQPKFAKQLRQLRKKYHADQHVMTIHGYSYRVPQLYRQSRLTLSTGPSDAFNISLLESLSQGCPAVVYDDNYGPRDMIKDGYNGYKVHNDYQVMANRIIELFKHPNLMQAMSDHAYQVASQYSPTRVWKLWQKVIRDAKRHWPDKLV